MKRDRRGDNFDIDRSRDKEKRPSLKSFANLFARKSISSRLTN